MPPILIDSNILIYAYDHRSPIRSERALAVLDALSSMGLGRLSVQCLSEFFNVVYQKAKILPLEDAYNQTQVLSQSFTTFPLTPIIVVEAMRGVRDHQLNYWDALIWASAKLNQVSYVFSEDFSSGSTIEGVQFINPFIDSFSIDDWLS
jgi:predicted nucleic acid-binding protein